MSKRDPKIAGLPRRGFIRKASAGLGTAALGGLGGKEATAAEKRPADSTSTVSPNP